MKKKDTICSVSECDHIADSARGWCSTHYSRWRLHGDPNITLYIRGDDAARFWAKVDKGAKPPAHRPSLGSCWVWNAARNDGGYGEFRYLGKTRKAHRVSYELSKGAIPEGMDLDHKCRNTSCVRPDHLRPVTNKQNTEHRDVASNNTSGYRGVSWHKGSRKWSVYLTHNGMRVNGGYFTDVHEAGRVARLLRNGLFTHNDMDRKAAS